MCKRNRPALPGKETSEMITDTEARRISSEWHGRGGSALYALASTGAIDTARDDHNTLAEISESWFTDLAPEEWRELAALNTYVFKIGKRGPIEGWGTLTW
jgi:hypothetical protein